MNGVVDDVGTSGSNVDGDDGRDATGAGGSDDAGGVVRRR